MMSKEARNLFLNGGGEEALAMWKAKYYTEKLELPDASTRWTSEVRGQAARVCAMPCCDMRLC
jgi:hypothetical protein